MRSNYKRLGGYIRQVKLRNTSDNIDLLLGINIDKFFMPSVANVNGTDLSKYKVVKLNQFACNRMHVGRDYRLPISLSKYEYDFIVSPAYDVFEIIDHQILEPEYLMMWFSRPEFDRESWFHTDTDVRGKLGWDDFCDMKLPIPSIEKQREIVKEYNVIVNRTKLNEELNKKLEDTAQALYKHWFVDFEFPITKEYANEISRPELEGKPYKSNGGEMIFSEKLEKEIPLGWSVEDLGDLLLNKGYIRGPFGSSLKKDDMVLSGIPIYEQQHAIHNHRIFRYYISEDKYKDLKRFTVKTNDMVISCSGTLGKVTMIMKDDSIGIINQALLILRPNEDKIKPICFKYFLTSSKGNKLLLENSSGSAQINIAKREIIQRIKYVRACIEVQKDLERLLLTLNKNIVNLKIQRDRLDDLVHIVLSRMSYNK